MLIDSHCHLNLIADLDDLDSFIKRAEENNVKYMQTICTKLEDLPSILGISEKYPNVFASAGVHPCEIGLSRDASNNHSSNAKKLTIEIVNATAHHKIIGIGETGLDYYRQSYDKKLQKDFFEAHIHAAQSTKLPIIVHTREAESDTIDILTSEMKNANFYGLIHCFTSSKDLAKKMLDIGLYISMSGIITFKNSVALQEIARYVPLDRLLIETDSPYLAPTPMRGKRNEPAYVRYVAEKIAELTMMDFAEVANVTTQNFMNLFTKFRSAILK